MGEPSEQVAFCSGDSLLWLGWSRVNCLRYAGGALLAAMRGRIGWFRAGIDTSPGRLGARAGFFYFLSVKQCDGNDIIWSFEVVSLLGEQRTKHYFASIGCCEECSIVV